MFSADILAQNPIGKYFDHTDYIEFTKDSIQLRVESNGGLIVELCVSGNYEILENYLMVFAKNYNGEKSDVFTEGKLGNHSQIKVLDKTRNSILGANIVYLNNSGKVIGGTSANEKGIGNIDNNKSIKKIKVAIVGYDDLTIDFSDSLDYEIVLTEYRVIENNTLVFKINSKEKDHLNLTLLTTDFKPKGDKLKSLKRLEIKMNKYKFSSRDFNK